jgi:SAM-dependent methyltransferase
MTCVASIKAQQSAAYSNPKPKTMLSTELALTPITFPKECPICRSPYVALARQIATERAGLVNLFHCMGCRSFFSPFAPDLSGPTLNHHRKVFDRNVGWTSQWLQAIQNGMQGPVRSVLDIGCGIGSLLFGLRVLGIGGLGYDLDIEACEFGRHEYGLDLRGDEWRAGNAADADFNLICCIMVLEHIRWPRPLLFELVKESRRRNCAAFVSVPWFNENWWPHLQSPLTEGSPLKEPWVHVTHFSSAGFESVCKEMGIKRRVWVGGIPWPGYLIWA